MSDYRGVNSVWRTCMFHHGSTRGTIAHLKRTKKKKKSTNAAVTILSFFCHIVCCKMFACCSNYLLDASWEDAFISPVIFHNAHLALSSIHFHFQSHCGPSLLSPLQQAGPASTLITIGRGVIDKAFFHQLTDGGLVNW